MKINLFKLLYLMAFKTFQTVRYVVIKVFNFVIILLYGTQNPFAISVNLLYPNSL